MDLVFCFHFCDPTTEMVSRSLAFYAANVNTTLDKLSETMARHTEKMSTQYGVQGGLFFASINLMSYNSVDINPEQYDLVMAAWRNAFANDLTDCAVGEVYDVTNVGGNTEIYEYTKQAYEDEKLRTTLTIHITTTSLVAPSKKI